MLQDPKGDGTSTFLGDPITAPNDPAWDIVSADVASDGKTLTGVLRVDKLAMESDTSPTGIHWRIDFDVAGGSNRIFVQGRATPFGDPTFSAGYVSTTSSSYAAGTATGVVDVDKNEVRVSFPVSAAAAQAVIKSGTKISGVVAAAGRFINTAGGNPSLSDFSDTAEGTRTYTVGEASCVAVGK